MWFNRRRCFGNDDEKHDLLKKKHLQRFSGVAKRNRLTGYFAVLLLADAV